MVLHKFYQYEYKGMKKDFKIQIFYHFSRHFFLRISCNAHFSSILWNGLATALERYYNGLTAKAKRGQKEGIEIVKYELEKNFFAIILHTYIITRAIY